MVAQFVAEMAWQALFGPGKLLFCAVLLTVIWVLLALAIVTVFRVDRVAGWLVLPGITWVSIATLLAWTLYRLNRSA